MHKRRVARWLAQFPSLTLWLEAPLFEDVRARLRYDFGYAWFDTDPFVATNSGQLSLLREGDLGSTEVYARVHQDRYFFESDDVFGAIDLAGCGVVTLCGPVGLDERRERDRDGWGSSAGLMHTLPLPTESLPIAAAALRGGYRFTHYEAQGREYTHDSHEASLGLAAQLPFELGLDVSGRFAYLPYRHASSFPTQAASAVRPYPLASIRRLERDWRVETRVTRAVSENVSVSAKWRYVDHYSNTDVFDYDQHVLGVEVTVGIGREL